MLQMVRRIRLIHLCSMYTVPYVQRIAYSAQRPPLNRRRAQYAVRSTKKGFTLLEVMLAILLLGTGLVALIQIVSVGLFAGVENDTELVAINLVQEKAEEIRNKSFSGITIAPEAKAVMASPFQKFKRSVDVANNTPVTNMNKVTVTVYWDTEGIETNKTFITYVSTI